MNILDDRSSYHPDSDDMYQKIIHLPDQIRKAYFSPNLKTIENTAKDVSSTKKPIRRVMIVGMGGSAISGDLIKASYSSLIPIDVYKDYQLPLINDDDLIIICSYSGNTEEILSCMEQALSKTEYLAAVTSNGKVKERIDGRYLWCELPNGYPPRSAIGFLFFSLIIVLEQFGIVNKCDETVTAIVSMLMMKAGAVAKNTAAELNIAKQAALSINNKIPLIYAGNPQFTPVAYRFKCQINENAKYPAFFHTLPEMNHNEIEAWENKELNKLFIPVFISSLTEDYSYRKRIDFLQSILKKDDMDYLHFYAEGNSYLEKAFSLIYLGDMISYYLAILRGIDPTKIDYIEKLKEAIS